MRVLPTLLGVLVLLAGVLAFVHTCPPVVPPPELVTLEPLPTTPFRAVLIQQTDGELRTRDVSLRAADTPPARLAATLRALRTWLVDEGAWPRELGAPRVFWLGEAGETSSEGRAALDFPVTGKVDVPVTTEVWLLESVRQTAARQGVADTFVLVNGRVPPTFLGQVSLPQTLGELGVPQTSGQTKNLTAIGSN